MHVDFAFKICVVGDKGVGKESLIETFGPDQTVTENSLTIGVEYYSKIIPIDTKEGLKKCKLWLWNIGGEEQFKFLYSTYYMGSTGFMVIFDLANRESFLHLPEWLEGIKMAREEKRAFGLSGKVPVLLVGNRSQSEYYVVSPKEINQFIRKHNLIYIETSTETEEGIVDSFYCITSLIFGVDIYSDYFLSKDVIYHPSSSPTRSPTLAPTLSPQDLRQLSHKAILQKLKPSESEESILLMILGEDGVLIFSYAFTDEWKFDEVLFGAFITAFDSISDEVFSEGLDRVKFGQQTILIKYVEDFYICYLFRGDINSAEQKLSRFTEEMKKDASIWQILEKCYDTGQVLKLKESPQLELHITESFEDKD